MRKTVIRSKESLFNVDLNEIIHYRDLLMMFVKRDIVTSYKQTILGPAWFFVNPILTTIMYMVVFGAIAKISTDGLPQPLFYLSGICLWNYFSECINRTSDVFVANEYVFGKVYFPRMIMPLSTVISQILRFGIQLLLFVALYIFYIAQGVAIAPNWHLLLLPLLVAMLAGLSLGCGIIVSSMTTKYRDLKNLFSFFVSLWMYATPVIYPLSTLSPSKQWIASINPVTPIFEAFKYGSMGVGIFSWTQLAYSFAFMLVLLFFGALIFNKVQRSFMDTV
ncbi:MAG: ABC transporter permease [Paludibacter sp.]|jgi:lipopolysaccharide transport system permease protein|nr:ABC transporter permease [Paludibacter sp.]